MIATPSALPARATATTWRIDPDETRVEFSLRHAVLNTVNGRFIGVRGTISFDPTNPATASTNVEIEAATIDTRSGDRDKHLRSPEFLDVERFPLIIFQSTKVEPLSADRFRIRGQLAIRDVTRDVVLPTTYHGRQRTTANTETVSFTAETSITRKDYGLNWNAVLETGGLVAGDTVKIVLAVQATRQGG